MKLRFTNHWLRSQIDKDADIECDAGIPLRDSTSITHFTHPEAASVATAPGLKMAVLSVLVHQLRRRDGLSVTQLAERLRVDADELANVESDPNYVPRPRTMHQLADYMKVSTQAVQSLTAEAIARNNNIAQAALKFAASSKDLSQLSNAERRGLNDFVKFLASYEEE